MHASLFPRVSTSLSKPNDLDFKSLNDEMIRSLVGRVGYSIGVAKSGFKKSEKSITEKLKDQLLVEKKNEFKIIIVKICEKILDEWKEEDDITKRSNNIRIKLDEAINALLLHPAKQEVKDKQEEKTQRDEKTEKEVKDKKDERPKLREQHADLVIQVDAVKLKECLEKIKNEFLVSLNKKLDKPFGMPLETYAAANAFWLKNRNPVFETEIAMSQAQMQQLSTYKRNMFIPMAWSAQLVAVNFKFNELPGRVEFFSPKQQLIEYKDEKYGNTPFHFCAWFDDLELAIVLKRLIEDLKKSKEYPVTMRNKRGFLPFQLVIRRSNRNTEKFLDLLEPSFNDLMSIDPQRMTSLEAAAYHGNRDAVSWIIKQYGEKIDLAILNKTFEIACSKEHNNGVVSILLSELTRRRMYISDLQPSICDAIKKGNANSLVEICNTTWFSKLEVADDELAGASKCISALVSLLSDKGKEFELRQQKLKEAKEIPAVNLNLVLMPISHAT